MNKTKPKSKTLPLYEIDKMYFEALDAAINDDGEIVDEEMFNFLDEIKGAKDKKLLNIACLYKDFLGEAAKLKAEKDNLNARQKAAENTAEKLKLYINMNIDDGEKIKNERAAISWRKSESLNVLCAVDDLPLEFKKIEITANKSLMKTYIKTETGKDAKGKPVFENKIGGVELIRKNNIQIK